MISWEADGNSPAKLSDISNNAKFFPVLFPKGHTTDHDYREQRLTLSWYVKLRLLHADRRFAHNVEYIFNAQYSIRGSTSCFKCFYSLMESNSRFKICDN